MNRPPLLFLNVLIIATCGLVYELLAGTLASYVLGDSVMQFSTCIGVYLFALGIGAWISGFIDDGLARCFIEVEFAVALLGGISAPLLFLCFAKLSFFHLVLYGIVLGIGILVGLELPLLMRILQDRMKFKDLISRVLTFDYIGALAGSLMFPLFLVPRLGLVRTSLMMGLLNVAVGLWGTWLLDPLLKSGQVVWLRVRGSVVVVILLVGFIKADTFTTLAEDDLFINPVVYAETTSYQRIVVTRSPDGFQLYLNGSLQFNSADEYRYHEALVHPSLSLVRFPRNVLILGGGDGLAAREVLRHPEVEQVTLVDLDPAMTALPDHYPPLKTLNEASLDSEKLTIVNEDAYIWLQQQTTSFDAIVIDFPDPNTFSLSKLYTRRFFRMLKARLAPDGALSMQCTSPLFSRSAYWCIIHTLEEAGFTVRPYQVPVPSFGIWGFALARHQPFELPTELPEELKYLTPEVLAGLFVFPSDLAKVETEVNRLDNQILVRYYAEVWKPPR